MIDPIITTPEPPAAAAPLHVEIVVHEHEDHGRRYGQGDTLETDALTAAWLVTHGIGVLRD